MRVGAILRRLRAPALATGGRLSAGPILIDKMAHRVFVDGEEVAFTTTEFRLLHTLIEREGRVQTRRNCSKRYGRRSPTCRPAPSICICSDCAASWAPRAAASRPCGEPATASGAPSQKRGACSTRERASSDGLASGAGSSHSRPCDNGATTWSLFIASTAAVTSQTRAGSSIARAPAVLKRRRPTTVPARAPNPRCTCRDPAHPRLSRFVEGILVTCRSLCRMGFRRPASLRDCDNGRLP